MIERASKMGFCFGVKEAIELSEGIIKKNKNQKVYMYGMLVHNIRVINDLKNKGIYFLSENDIKILNENDIVIVRAHGAKKDEYEKLKKKNVKIYDAACIFVKRSREILVEKENQGYKIIFVGDKDHPEVQGIVSFGSEKVEILNDDVEVIARIKQIDNKQKYFIIFQTTLNNKVKENIETHIKNKYKNIEIGNTICGATYERQIAAEKLAKRTDLMLVVGDNRSSNTKKLYEISKKANENTYLIQDEIELDKICLDRNLKIGITAGASTPEITIKEIEKKINTILSEEES